jgi:hypothetical protein
MTERAGSDFSLALVEGGEDKDVDDEMGPSTAGLWLAGAGSKLA